MSNFYARQGAAHNNELNRSFATLIGIAQGLICDGHLNDGEISFLHEWLENNDVILSHSLGYLVYERVRKAISDGVITDDERMQLIDTLLQLVGGTFEGLAKNTHVSSLVIDDVVIDSFVGKRFVLTGTFVFAERSECERLIEELGGEVASSISKKVDYVVVGRLGSKEWKYGSFGTKVDEAMLLKQKGIPIFIIHEESWVSSFLDA